jgi:hypothetical protein
MKHAASHMKLQAASVALALALFAPAAAHAASTGGQGPLRAGRSAASSSGTIVVDSEQGRFRHARGASGRPMQARPVEAVRRPDLGWPDAVVGIGFMLGVVCLVLWIDMVVDAVARVPAGFGRGAMLVTRRRRRPGRPQALEAVSDRELSSTG